jgi:N utilization substance protein A
MSKEILAIVDTVSNEKQIDRDKVFNALEGALAIAIKKKFDNLEPDIKVEIDRKTGDYSVLRRYLIVDTDGPLANPTREISLEAAKLDDENAVAGDYVCDMIDDNVSLNILDDRITATTVKQVLQQKIREAERQQVIDEFIGSVGKLVIGIVKHASRNEVTLDLGNGAIAVMRRQNMLSRDLFRPSDRVRGILLPIKTDGKGPQLEVSRTSNDFLKELLTTEVPEIGEGQLEIVNVVRDPGFRAKVAIRAKDRRIDPKGACIGMKGSRIKNVSNELCQENIDIIIYDEDISKYVINAMEPAEVKQAIIDKDKKQVLIGVENDEKKYAKAIGSNGQNVRLASALIGDGWHINVMTVDDLENKQNEEKASLVSTFGDILNIDSDFAQALIDARFDTIELVAFSDPKDILNDVEGLDDELVAELQKVAREALKNIQTPSGRQVDASLINLDGLDNADVRALASREIASLEELAECATEDLVDLPEFDREKASSLIMKARNIAWNLDEMNK